MQLGLVAASLVLVACGAVGCGDDVGGGGGSADAPSTDDFCGALKDFKDDFSDADPTDPNGYLKALEDAAAKLDDVGVPDDMPDDARDGFDITIKAITDLPDDATLDDLAQIGDVSDKDRNKLDALDEYISKECPDLDGETGTDTP